MKIVIELSDETYKDIKEENSIYGINNGLSARITGKVVGAIQSGTPFPEEIIKTSEQEPTTKNDLGVDCISRADAIRVASGYCHPSNVANELAKLPSVTPQEPCDKCEVGNPCLYCKHEFEPQESEDKE